MRAVRRTAGEGVLHMRAVRRTAGEGVLHKAAVLHKILIHSLLALI
jgi:hypothetical protein